MIRYSILILSVMLLSSGTLGEKKQKPTIYLIGDSTVKNGSGKGAGGLCKHLLIDHDFARRRAIEVYRAGNMLNIPLPAFRPRD